MPLFSSPADPDRAYPIPAAPMQRGRDRSRIPKGHHPIDSITQHHHHHHHRPSSEERKGTPQALDWLEDFQPLPGHGSLSKHPVLSSALKNKNRSTRLDSNSPVQATDATGHQQDFAAASPPPKSFLHRINPLHKFTTSTTVSPTIPKPPRPASNQDPLGFARKEKKASQHPRSHFQATASLLDPKKARKVETAHAADDDVFSNVTEVANTRNRTERPSRQSLPLGSSPQSAIPIDSPEAEERKPRRLHQAAEPTVELVTPTKSTALRRVANEIVSVFENEDRPLPGLELYNSTGDKKLSSAGADSRRAQAEVNNISSPLLLSKATISSERLHPMQSPKSATKLEGPSEVVTTLDDDPAQKMAGRTHLANQNEKGRDAFSSPYKKRPQAPWNSMLEPRRYVPSDRSLKKVFEETRHKNSENPQVLDADGSQDELLGPPSSIIQADARSRGQVRKEKAAKQTYATSVTGGRPASPEQIPSFVDPGVSHIPQEALEDSYHLVYCRTYGFQYCAPESEALLLVYDAQNGQFHVMSTNEHGYDYHHSFDHKRFTKAVSDNDSIVRLTGSRSGKNTLLWDLRFESQAYFLHFMGTHMEQLPGFTHQNNKGSGYMLQVLQKHLDNGDDHQSAAVDENAELRLLETRTQKHSHKREHERKPMLVSQLRGREHGLQGNAVTTYSPNVPDTSSPQDTSLFDQLRASAAQGQDDEKQVSPHFAQNGTVDQAGKGKDLKPVRARTQRITRASSAENKLQPEAPKAPKSTFKQFKAWGGELNIKYDHARAVLFHHDLERLDADQCLNDAIIDFKVVWDMVNSGERAKRLYAFSGLFYGALTELSSLSREEKASSCINYKRVSKWTTRAKVDIFSKDYLIIPVVENFHWYLVLVCNVQNIKRPPHEEEANDVLELQHQSVIPESPADDKEKPASKEHTPLSEDPDAMQLVDAHTNHPSDNQRRHGILLPSPAKSMPVPKTTKQKKAIRDPDEPVLLVLDSLGKTHPKAVKCIKAYLAAEGKAKRDMDVEITSKPLYVKCIPQQDNAIDCGMYVLAYLEKFMDNPKAFVSSILNGEMDPVRDWPDMDAAQLRIRLQTQLMRSGQMQDQRRKQQRKKGQGKSGESDLDSLSFLQMAVEEMIKKEQLESHASTMEPALPSPTAEQTDATATMGQAPSIRDDSPRVVIPSSKSAGSPKAPSTPHHASPNKRNGTKRARSDDDSASTSPGSKSSRNSNESPHPQPPALPSVASVKRPRSEDVIDDEEAHRAKSPKKRNKSPNPTPGSAHKPIRIDDE